MKEFCPQISSTRDFDFDVPWWDQLGVRGTSQPHLSGNCCTLNVTWHKLAISLFHISKIFPYFDIVIRYDYSEIFWQQNAYQQLELVQVSEGRDPNWEDKQKTNYRTVNTGNDHKGWLADNPQEKDFFFQLSFEEYYFYHPLNDMTAEMFNAHSIRKASCHHD